MNFSKMVCENDQSSSVRKFALLLVVSGNCVLLAGTCLFTIESVRIHERIGIIVDDVMVSIAYGLTALAWWGLAGGMLSEELRNKRKIVQGLRVLLGASLLLVGGDIAISAQAIGDQVDRLFVASYITDVLGAAIVSAAFWHLARVIKRVNESSVLQ